MRSAFGLVFGLMMSSTILAQGQQAPQAGRGGRGGQAAPEARIVTFEARPGSIRPGESAVLVWRKCIGHYDRIRNCARDCAVNEAGQAECDDNIYADAPRWTNPNRDRHGCRNDSNHNQCRNGERY